MYGRVMVVAASVVDGALGSLVACSGKVDATAVAVASTSVVSDAMGADEAVDASPDSHAAAAVSRTPMARYARQRPNLLMPAACTDSSRLSRAQVGR